jgi:hypothetical protein
MVHTFALYLSILLIFLTSHTIYPAALPNNPTANNTLGVRGRFTPYSSDSSADDNDTQQQESFFIGPDGAIYKAFIVPDPMTKKPPKKISRLPKPLTLPTISEEPHPKPTTTMRHAIIAALPRIRRRSIPDIIITPPDEEAQTHDKPQKKRRNSSPSFTRTSAID